MRGPLALALVGVRHATRTRLRAASSSALEWASPENRRKHASRKWGRFDENLIPLWVADGDALAPLQIREAVAEAAKAGIYGYVDPSASLLQAVTAGMSGSWGRSVSTDWVRWHPGLIPALYHAARLAGPNGAVVVPTSIVSTSTLTSFFFLKSERSTSHGLPAGVADPVIELRLGKEVNAGAISEHSQLAGSNLQAVKCEL